MSTLVPMMSAGIRSGVNWMRLNEQSMTSASGPHEHRLAQAGHALEQRVAVGDEADQRLPDEVVLADDDRLDLGLDALGRGRRTPRPRARLAVRLLERRLGHRLLLAWPG